MRRAEGFTSQSWSRSFGFSLLDRKEKLALQQSDWHNEKEGTRP